MMSKHGIADFWLAVALMLGLTACGGEQESVETVDFEEEVTVAKIEGEVFYRERMMLPPGAEVEVQLQDVSRPDALAAVMETVMFKAEGGPPYAFIIHYDPADIDERSRYSLRATITHGDQLMFTSTEFIDPFNDETISIMLQRVPEPVLKAPVASVETSSAGDEVVVAEVNVGSESSTNALWLLDTLAGQTASLGAGGKAIELSLNAQDQTVSGFSGCNRYRGSYSSDGNSNHGTPLKFGPMASTKRACAGDDEIERTYLKALGDVDSYRIQGSSLALLQGKEVVATFRLR